MATDVTTEHPEHHRWNLQDLFNSPEEWDAERRAIEQEMKQIENWRGRLSEGATVLRELLDFEDALDERAGRLFAYAMLERDLDTRNSGAIQRFEQVMSLAVALGRTSSFIAPELLTLSDEQLHGYLEADPGLETYRRTIERIMRERPHVRSAEVEEVLADSAEIAQTAGNVFTFLDNADITYGTITDTDGSEIQITKGRYQRLLERPEREIRRAAYEALHQPYMEHRNSLGALQTATVQKDAFYARSHRYGSAMEAALKPDAIPLEVYTNLIETVRKFSPLLHRYVELKKRVLGIDDPHNYDLYLPLVEMPDRTYSFEEASETVVAALAPLGEEYTNTLRDGLQSRWVDVPETQGKRSGAYSLGVYGVHPFVLMNWNGSLNDVFTLTHEVGHAMHSLRSNHFQPHATSQYTIFVAEVASTANEQMLTAHLLNNTDDPRERAYLVNDALESIRTTIFRQTMFAEFEKVTHELVEAGEGLTPERLSDEYSRLVSDYYGESLVIDDQVAIEWSRVPHFYRAFYVYQYATGLIAAMALSSKILDGDIESRDRYLAFLSSGSSKDPLDLLRDAGVDLTTEEPYQAAFNTMERYLDTLEAAIASGIS